MERDCREHIVLPRLLQTEAGRKPEGRDPKSNIPGNKEAAAEQSKGRIQEVPYVAQLYLTCDISQVRVPVGDKSRVKML